MSCTAPGRLLTETTRLVQSWPEACGAGCRCGCVTMAKRVRLCGSSWIAGATTCSPYSLAARSLAMAASVGSSPARRAPSALLATGRRSALGRWLASQPWHCASACGCASTALMPSSESLRRSRLWRTNRLVSPMMNSGVCRNRSSERATTPSVLFSTGTTPKSAAPAVVVRKTSSMLAQGTRVSDEPK